MGKEVTIEGEKFIQEDDKTIVFTRMELRAFIRGLRLKWYGAQE